MSVPSVMGLLWLRSLLVEFGLLAAKINFLVRLALQALLELFPLLAPAVLLPLLLVKGSLFLFVLTLFVPVLLLHHGTIGLIFTPRLLFVISTLLFTLFAILVSLPMAMLSIQLFPSSAVLEIFVKVLVIVAEIATIFLISFLVFDPLFGLLHLFFSSLASAVLCFAFILTGLSSGLFLIFPGRSTCFVLSIKFLLLEFIHVSMLFILLFAECFEGLALIIFLFRLDLLLESSQVV